MSIRFSRFSMTVASRAVAAIALLGACGGAAQKGASAPSHDVALSSTPDASKSTLAERGAAGLAVIHANQLSASMRFLADDALEGRGTGERGARIAARYIASELASFGVEPAGEHGDFFQTVPFRGEKLDLAKSELRVAGGKGPPLVLEPAKDFILGSDGVDAVTEWDAPLVFVGYGVSAPEFGYDDLAGVDLHGKIAVALFGAPLSDRPDFFPNSMHAHYTSRKNKLHAVMKRGAKGLIVVETPDLTASLTWPKFVDQYRFEQMDWIDRAHGGKPGSNEPGLRGWLSGVAFDKLLLRAGIDERVPDMIARADKKALGGRDLGLRAHAKSVAALRDLESDNVAGVIRGSDPALAHEFVVLTAHLDHLGIGPAVNGDSIYNGAGDDASGCASVLEMARAFAAMPKKPRRSILFLFVTGEEKGLLGSEYFAAYPTVPIASIVADVNIDGALVFWRIYDLEPIGLEHSTLSENVAEAAKVMNLTVSPDSAPEKVLFIRSDQYSFVKRGVPSVFMGEGSKDETGHTEKNLAIEKAVHEKLYHMPQDEWSPDLLFDEAARFTKVGFLTALSIAERTERPAWHPGDFYAPKTAK